MGQCLVTRKVKPLWVILFLKVRELLISYVHVYIPFIVVSQEVFFTMLIYQVFP